MLREIDFPECTSVSSVVRPTGRSIILSWHRARRNSRPLSDDLRRGMLLERRGQEPETVRRAGLRLRMRCELISSVASWDMLYVCVSRVLDRCPSSNEVHKAWRGLIVQPEMSQVILIRPGATLYDEQNRVQGVLDVPLSERGRGEVVRMAEMLSYSLGDSSLAALYCGPGENVIRTAEIVGKLLRLRPKRINEFRNLDQGLWQGLQIDEIKRTEHQAVPPVDRRPGDDLSAPGRDRRACDGTDQDGIPAAPASPPGRGDRPGRRGAAGAGWSPLT